MDLKAVRVLIVDDEPLMRRTIRQMLQVIGISVVQEFADGQSALDALAFFKPDVVLCDIEMAPMTELHFVETLRGHGDAKLRETPVIMLTANAGEGTVNTAARLGNHGYLVKPVSPKQLRTRLETALSRKPAPAATS